MKKLTLLFASILLLFSVKIFSQTLSSGDVVIVAYNADADKFSFLALNNLSSGTVINFTNIGWQNSDFYYDGETANRSTIIEYTLTSEISYGTVVTYTASSNTFSPSNGTIIRYYWTGSKAVSTTAIDWSSLGDNLLVYQGSEASPTFIFGLNVQWRDSSNPCTLGGHSTTHWQIGCYASFSYTDSELPTGLTNGTNAVTICPGNIASLEVDNTKYSGTTSGTGTFLLSEVCNYTNWSGHNSNEQSPESFTVTSPLPVELTYFNVLLNNGIAELKWETATEVNNYGFEVERAIKNEELEINNWEKIGFVLGHGNSNSPKQYEFIDTSPFGDDPPAGHLKYRLKQIDTDGTYEYYNLTAEVDATITSLNDEKLPEEFHLSQNYPNPFNPVTQIEYLIPVGDVQNVKLKVFDILGKDVVTLIDKSQLPGNYRVEFDGSSLSSGIYFYQLITKNYTSTKKFILMK